ncbi:MAG: ubiquinol-cytochrome c reductase iron-sulfur subunit [Chloroflexi bacterium]|nr:ubiquinol-cytochrome c reductase iron-sulfur subunit [Chloroflexota bacterium]
MALISAVIVLTLVGIAIVWANHHRSWSRAGHPQGDQAAFPGQVVPAPVAGPPSELTHQDRYGWPEPPETLTRRRLLRNTFYAIVGAMVGTLSYPALRYFIYPAVRKLPPAPFTPIASLAEFQIGVPTFVTYEERVLDGWVVETRSKGAWVVYSGEDRVLVFDPHCTHLGCGYSWHAESQRFLCPCHAGVFDIEGAVVSGPPPRPLDRIAHQIAEGTLLVSRTIKSTELKG